MHKKFDNVLVCNSDVDKYMYTNSSKKILLYTYILIIS